MLHAIANAQSTNKQELLTQIKKLENKVDTNTTQIKKLDTKLTQRIDGIGKNLAFLEDDAPTRKEHKDHDKRLKKLETKAFA